MEHAILRPAVKGKLLCPTERRPLHEDGERKPLNRFWQRRLAAGEVEIVSESELEARRLVAHEEELT